MMRLSPELINELCDPWNEELREYHVSVISALKKLDERDQRIAKDFGISKEEASRFYYTLDDKQRRTYD